MWPLIMMEMLPFVKSTLLFLVSLQSNRDYLENTNFLISDNTPPLLSCPQSYVIELVDKQESYSVNFNETRRRINTSDASGEVQLTFKPDKATIPVGSFENVTVTATDKHGNRATCHFQVNLHHLYLFAHR